MNQRSRRDRNVSYPKQVVTGSETATICDDERVVTDHGVIEITIMQSHFRARLLVVSQV
jgi:hypothetical protein